MVRYLVLTFLSAAGEVAAAAIAAADAEPRARLPQMTIRGLRSNRGPEAVDIHRKNRMGAARNHCLVSDQRVIDPEVDVDRCF